MSNDSTAYIYLYTIYFISLDDIFISHGNENQ